MQNGRQCGVHQSLVDSYLCEVVWRQLINDMSQVPPFNKKTKGTIYISSFLSGGAYLEKKGTLARIHVALTRKLDAIALQARKSHTTLAKAHTIRDVYARARRFGVCTKRRCNTRRGGRVVKAMDC